MGSLGVAHDWATSLSLFTFMQWRRKWQPTPVFLPGESQGQRSLVGCHLWGHTELDTTKVMQQQQGTLASMMRTEAWQALIPWSLSSWITLCGSQSHVSSPATQRQPSCEDVKASYIARPHGEGMRYHTCKWSFLSLPDQVPATS